MPYLKVKVALDEQGTFRELSLAVNSYMDVRLSYYFWIIFAAYYPEEKE